MNRPIKFRAWSKKYHQMWVPFAGISWVVDHDYDEPERDISSQPQTVYVGDKASPNPAADVEIMQYTGLKDKNGMEIYEGDIVSRDDERGAVVWYQPGARFYINQNTPILPNCQVIGNIYENPDLLKDRNE